MLRGFAERVRQHTRPVDIVARYGGEEIVVILPEAGLAEAQIIAERIRERVEAAGGQLIVRHERGLSTVLIAMGADREIIDDGAASEEENR